MWYESVRRGSAPSLHGSHKRESAVSVSHRSLLVSHHRTLLVGENYYSFHKQEWKTITRLAAKQVRMHVNRAHIDWVHVMHIQAQARKRLILLTYYNLEFIYIGFFTHATEKIVHDTLISI